VAHGGVHHAANAPHDGLEVLELDPEAVDLDLPIDTAAELDNARPVDAYQVSRAIEAVVAAARKGGIRVRGVAEVTSPHGGAADVELARGVARVEGAVRRRNEQARPAERRPDRHRGRRCVVQRVEARNHVSGDADRRLRRPIVVHEDTSYADAERVARELWGQKLAADDQVAKARPVSVSGPERVQHGAPMRRRDLQDVDARRAQVAKQPDRVPARHVIDDVKRAARPEREEQPGVAEVGGERAHVRVAQRLRDLEPG